MRKYKRRQKKKCEGRKGNRKSEREERQKGEIVRE